MSVPSLSLPVLPVRLLVFLELGGGRAFPFCSPVHLQFINSSSHLFSSLLRAWSCSAVFTRLFTYLCGILPWLLIKSSQFNLLVDPSHISCADFLCSWSLLPVPSLRSRIPPCTASPASACQFSELPWIPPSTEPTPALWRILLLPSQQHNAQAQTLTWKTLNSPWTLKPALVHYSAQPM